MLSLFFGLWFFVVVKDKTVLLGHDIGLGGLVLGGVLVRDTGVL